MDNKIKEYIENQTADEKSFWKKHEIWFWILCLTVMNFFNGELSVIQKKDG